MDLTKSTSSRKTVVIQEPGGIKSLTLGKNSTSTISKHPNHSLRKSHSSGVSACSRSPTIATDSVFSDDEYSATTKTKVDDEKDVVPLTILAESVRVDTGDDYPPVSPVLTSDATRCTDDEYNDASEEPLASAMTMIAAANALRDSRVVKPANVERLPRLRTDEVTVGRFLGRGGFYDVYEVEGIATSWEENELHAPTRAHLSTGQQNGEDVTGKTTKGNVIKKNKSRKNKNSEDDSVIGGRYAVKCMRKDVVQNKTKYLTAIKDIVTETHLLASLDHPNIMKIRAVVPCEEKENDETEEEMLDGKKNHRDRPVFNKNKKSSKTKNNLTVSSTSLMERCRVTGQDAGYVLLMDRLFGTLNERLDEWRSVHSSTPCFSRIFQRNHTHQNKASLLRTRLSVAHDLSEAMRYLHRHDIFYRDLKPDNIGLDRTNRVRLFDFGLAKEVRHHHQHCDEEGRYRLSMVGTPRYMAPEVLRGESYNNKADVYSFGIVLWELLSLRKAFEGWPFTRLRNQAALRKEVMLNTTSVPHGSVMAKDLIKNCCSFDWKMRPNFEDVSVVLRTECERMGKVVQSEDGNDVGMFETGQKHHSVNICYMK